MILRNCERGFNFARQDPDVRFHKDAFVSATDDAHFQPAKHKVSPTVSRIE